MAKYFILIATIVLVGFSLNAANLPTDHTPNSDYYIDYSDLDYILKGSVLNMGPSTHRPPKSKLAKLSGTKLQMGNVKITRQEGNRVLFHAFKGDERLYLRKMLDELLAIPSDLPLAALSRNEQLAYWFNLYTSIVLTEISERYPITYLEPLFDKNDPNSLVNNEQYMLDGTKVSLATIEDHVMSNWNDPVVIYGFYLGAIGTPNARTSAYNGETVYSQLRENAVDFVNSMRGTQMWNPSELRISKYYQRMAPMFPSFETSVLAHIKEYAKPAFKQKLVTVATISPQIKDWSIADLYNGNLTDPEARIPRTTVDGNDQLFKLRIPQHVIQIMRERERKISRQEPNVVIEEIPSPEKPD